MSERSIASFDEIHADLRIWIQGEWAYQSVARMTVVPNFDCVQARVTRLAKAPEIAEAIRSGTWRGPSRATE